MKKERKVIIPMLVVFILVNGFLLTATSLLAKWKIDREVLIVANLVFFTVSLLVFFMQKKSMRDPNPHVFIRSVMGGMMIKMLICIAVIIGYAALSGDTYNKPAVFIALFLYLVYLAVEVGAIIQLNKKPDA